jgi:hypothetical protein
MYISKDKKTEAKSDFRLADAHIFAQRLAMTFDPPAHHRALHLSTTLFLLSCTSTCSL